MNRPVDGNVAEVGDSGDAVEGNQRRFWIVNESAMLPVVVTLAVDAVDGQLLNTVLLRDGDVYPGIKSPHVDIEIIWDVQAVGE